MKRIGRVYLESELVLLVRLFTRLQVRVVDRGLDI